MTGSYSLPSPNSNGHLPLRARMATRSTYSGTRQQVRLDLWLAFAIVWLAAALWYAGEIRAGLLSSFTRHVEYVEAHAAGCEYSDPGTVPVWWGPDGKRHDGRVLLVNELRCGRV